MTLAEKHGVSYDGWGTTLRIRTAKRATRGEYDEDDVDEDDDGRRH
ncbi:hypothetical protein [Edwardsiella tarda]